MRHPQQFAVNEVWIAFQLNENPLQTDEDGAFNCLALMDAASCFLLGTEFIAAAASEPGQLEVRRLLKKGKSHKNQLPRTLWVSQEYPSNLLAQEATRQKISVVPVPEAELQVFIGEAREGFRERFG